MSPSPVIETIPQDLTSRLQRIGSALTDSAASRRSIRPVMSAGDRASRPRRRRDALAALVVAIAGVTMSTLTFSAGTGDPVIGVIPKNTAHRDILWIRLNVPAPDDAPPWYRLINVDGTDVMIAEETDRTKSSDSAATLTEIAGRKVSLVDSERSASASWMLENQRAFGLTMAPKNPKFRAVVEAVVQQSVAQQPDASSPTAFTTPRMKEVERRDLGVASLFIELKGTTRGSGNEVANGVFSQEVPISEEIAQRMFAASGMSVKAFRSDRFLVGASANNRNVRPLRLSEFRRTVRMVDRDRASEIAKSSWAPVMAGVEFGTSSSAGPSSVTCVRASADVACGQWLINRLLGSRWVYTTVGVRDVRANGVLQKGHPTTGTQSETQRVFVFPSSVNSIVTTTSTNGRDLVERTVHRPTY